MGRRFAFAADDRQIFRLAVPALGALAAEPLVSLADTAFVGRLGADSLAALGVVTWMFGLVFYLMTALAHAGTSLIAGAMGEGDRGRAAQLVSASLAAAAVLGLAGLAVMEAAAPQLTALMGAAPSVAPLAVDFLRIRALSLPALLWITVGHETYRGMGDTRTPMLVTVAAALLNLVLDPVMIFWWGWGLNGAAVASVIAQTAGGAVFMFLLASGRAGLRLPRRPQWATMKTLLGAGSALTLRTLVLAATFTLAAAAAARLGVVEIAAHQVAIQIFVFLSLVMDGLAIAAESLVARRLGEGDGAGARRLSNRMLGWGVIWGSALGAVIWVLRGPMAGWFSSDPQVAAAAAGLLSLVALSQPAASAVFVLDGILIGQQRFRFLAAAMLGACLPTMALLAAAPSVTLVWWAIMFLLAARLLPLAWSYARHTSAA